MYADLACLRGTYSFLRDQRRLYRSKCNSINGHISKWGYIARFGFKRYDALCADVNVMHNELNTVKNYIEQNWTNYSRLESDSPLLIDWRTRKGQMGSLMLCSLQGYTGTGEVKRLDVSNNILQHLEGLPENICTIDMSGNNFVEITPENIHLLSKSANKGPFSRPNSWYVTIPSSLQHFPTDTLLFCVPGCIDIKGRDNQQKEELRQKIAFGWHSWVRKALRWSAYAGISFLVIYGLYEIYAYFDAWLRDIERTQQITQYEYVQKVIDRHGLQAVTNACNAYHVAKNCDTVFIPQLVQNYTPPLEEDLLKIVSETPQVSGSLAVECLAGGSMIGGLIAGAVSGYVWGGLVHDRFDDHTIKIEDN